MFVEFKEVYKIMTVCLRYPDAADFGEDAVLVEQDPSDPEDVRYRIQGITSGHRKSMAVLCLLRVCITGALTVVGVSYIVKTNGYTDLLMNGVTLVFVATIASSLYNQVLREEIRDQCEDIKAIKVEMYGWEWLNRRPALLDMACVLFIALCCYGVMQWQMKNVVLPVSTALECTCISSGSKCFEANHFNKQFWDTYWMDTVPGVFKEVSSMKSKMPAGMASNLVAHSGSQSVTNVASLVRDDRELEERMQTIVSQNQELARKVERLESQILRKKNEPSAATPYMKNLHSFASNNSSYVSSLTSSGKSTSRATYSQKDFHPKKNVMKP